jgi:hypothetical protein
MYLFGHSATLRFIVFYKRASWQLKTLEIR